MRTLFQGIVSGAALLVLLVPTAQAQWVVNDPINTAQSVIQVSNQVAQLANEAMVIANQVVQINHQLQQLQRLAGGEFAGIAGLAAQQNADLGNLLANATAMQYSLAGVQAQIDAAYPQGSAEWGAFDMSTLAARRQQWDGLITEAGSTAARAQSSLSRIEQRNLAIGNLLTAAQAEDGGVRQAQISNQMAGNLAQSVNDLVAVQTTAQRLAMVEAQTAVAEREAAREQSRRRMQNFTDAGPAVVPLGGFPAVN